MATKRLDGAAVLIAVACCLLCVDATHTYGARQAYKTGAYIGKTAFQAADFQNRHCLSLRKGSFQGSCQIKDLGQDSVMEDALASAWIVPMSDSDSTALHSGFRAGWRDARMAAFR
jgi:hypothetical protein